MLCVQERSIKNAMEMPTLLGSGIRDRKMAEGRCVSTMVLTKPIRFAIDDATRFDADEMIFVVKNRVPSVPSETENLRLKK